MTFIQQLLQSLLVISEEQQVSAGICSMTVGICIVTIFPESNQATNIKSFNTDYMFNVQCLFWNLFSYKNEYAWTFTAKKIYNKFVNKN